MTHNSIAYYQAQQSEVANLETARSNRVREAIQDYEAKSNDAYRRGIIAINTIQAEETAKHNRAVERLQERQNEIQASHNAAIQAIQSRQADIAERSALWNAQYQQNVVKLDAAKVAETRRSNLAKEAETSRYNTGNLQIGASNSFWQGVGTVLKVPAAILGSVVTLSTLKGVRND